MGSLDGTAFDFWLGEWDCHFEGGHAVNTVTRESNGHSYRPFVGTLFDGDPS